MTGARAGEVVRGFLSLEHQGAIFQHKAVKAAFLVIAMALVLAQQGSLLMRKDSPDPFYRNVLNLGASYQRYFSFFYYFGGFPVNLDGLKTSTLDDATATLANQGPKLRTDLNVYNRASVFLFYPETWLRGRPDTAEMRTGMAVWFTTGLLAVVVALWYAGMPLLGLVVALLCGSNPFQIYEIYHMGSSTIFPMVISTGLVGTALSIVLIHQSSVTRPRLAIVLLAVAGAVCALQYEIRLEGVGVFFGAAVALALLSAYSPRRRLAYLFLFAISVVGVSKTMDAYFNAKLVAADRIVEQYGGTPAKTSNAYYSTQWWALWSGLGDFDEKYGFLVDDRAGISYHYGHDTTVDFETSMRKDYLRIAANDPLWWLGIVADRLKRVTIDNTPYRLGYGTWHTDLPVNSRIVTALGIVVLIAAVWTWHTTALALFVLPLSIGLVSIGQLADYGLQFYCIIHLFALAYVACIALDGLLAILLAAGRSVGLLVPAASLAKLARPVTSDQA